jgi:hypothetical protein
VISANLKRRQLTAAQRAAIAAEARELLKAEARERQKAGGHAAGRGRPIGSLQSITKLSAGRSAAQAAVAVGAGVGSTEAMASIRGRAPEVFKAVRAGLVATVADATSRKRLLMSVE